MKITVKIVETYTKCKEIEIEDTGDLDEAYEEVDKMVTAGKISLPSTDKESKYNMSVILI